MDKLTGNEAAFYNDQCTVRIRSLSEKIDVKYEEEQQRKQEDEERERFLLDEEESYANPSGFQEKCKKIEV